MRGIRHLKFSIQNKIKIDQLWVSNQRYFKLIKCQESEVKEQFNKRKTRTHKIITEEEFDEVPKSLVIRRTELTKDMKMLRDELRQLMYPFTAKFFQESHKMKIKEILSTIHNFNIKNLITLNCKTKGNYLKLLTVPKGPTFTFKINSYSLSNDLSKFLPRNKSVDQNQLGVPLVIVKNFLKETKHHDNKISQLLHSYFSNLFPSKNYFEKQNTKTFKRCVLFYYNDKKNVVEIRNYYMKQTFTNINPNIKKMLNSNTIPDFSKMNDVGELFGKNQPILSDSDIDHLPDSKVEIEDRIQGQDEKYKVNVRLFEIGPRLSLSLTKVQEGFLGGEVIFHAFVNKTEDEKSALRKKIAEREIQRTKNRKNQEENVRKKQEIKDSMREQKIKKFRNKEKALENATKKRENIQKEKIEEKHEDKPDMEYENFTGDANFV